MNAVPIDAIAVPHGAMAIETYALTKRFGDFTALDANGQPIDPYKTLPALPLGDAIDDEESITDGTGAIRVYQDLFFRQEADPKVRANQIGRAHV